MISYTNYTAFGAVQSLRSYSDSKRGFGNQEKDDEIYGQGNAYTAEYWEYDSRLGRRWNVDPVTKPWESPYAAFSNNPIYFNDPLGLDPDPPTVKGNPDEWKGDMKNNTIELKAVELGVAKILPAAKKGNFFAKVGAVLKNAGTRILGAVIKVQMALKEIETNAGVFLFAAANALASDNFLGAGRADPKGFGNYSNAARAGQTTGDLIAMVQGSGEMLIGGGAEVVGVALDATGVGAVAGVPLNVAGAAIAGHGATVLGVATHNMVEDNVNKSADNAHNNPSELPSIDKTGKVHGELPDPKDFSKYSNEELKALLSELKKSVQQRIKVTSKLGRDRAHGQRQGAEQNLIKSLEKYLKNSK